MQRAHDRPTETANGSEANRGLKLHGPHVGLAGETFLMEETPNFTQSGDIHFYAPGAVSMDGWTAPFRGGGDAAAGWRSSPISRSR